MAAVSVLIKAFKKALAAGDDKLSSKLSKQLKAKGVNTDDLMQGPSPLKNEDFGDHTYKGMGPEQSLEDLTYGPKEQGFGDWSYKGQGPEQSLDDLKYGPKEQGFGDWEYKGMGPEQSLDDLSYGPHKQNIDPSNPSARNNALAGAGLAGLGAGAGTFAYDYSEDPEANTDEFLGSLSSELSSKLGDRATEPVVEEEKKEEEEDLYPDYPSRGAGPVRGSPEDEVSRVREEDLKGIRSDRSEAQKRIQTKKLLASLIDAAGLAYGASQGVTSDIKTTPIDTSMDEYNMRQDETSARDMLRDKIRQIRAASAQKFADDRRASDQKYGDEVARYNADIREINKKLEYADKEEREKLLEEKRKKVEFRDNKKASEDNMKLYEKEKEKIFKTYKEARYEHGNDQEAVFDYMKRYGYPLTDQEKKDMVSEGFATTDVKPEDKAWASNRAVRHLKDRVERLGRQRMLEEEAGTSTSGRPAPHGQRVQQGNKYYVWNGSEYIEEGR